ncbi:hypothetical protein NLM16_27135 [Bradyrhizobium brasilense]|uniref:hypothetical protein n=1 Tax=Bradyrhizobium brasilense TaxID=1419277 RepID=UPI0028775F07|nr:hypothetical protein [Bradyrhizobium brasilense]MCP3417788.1 hypothetical protein [Bradyrhizobium brasilense]
MSQNDDDFDEFEGLDDEEVREELLRRLQTRGAAKALKTSMEVCDNKKAPAAARVQAASNILRAGGYFANRGSEGKEREPSEMTPAELQRALARAERGLAARLAGGNSDAPSAELEPRYDEPSAAGVFD